MNMRYLAIGVVVVAAVVFATLRLTDQPQNLTVSGAHLTLDKDDPTQAVLSFTLESLVAHDQVLGVVSEDGDVKTAVNGAEAETALVVPTKGRAIFSSDGVFFDVTRSTAFEADETVVFSIETKTAGTIQMVSRVVEAGGMKMTDGADDTAKSAMSGMDHSGHVMVPGDAPAPELQLTVAPDESGWSVTLEPENFEFFLPQDPDAMVPHVLGQGHAHLYLNGVKLQRLYGETATIGDLPAGVYTVRVSLNSNDHRAYMAKGKLVEATAELVVSE